MLFIALRISFRLVNSVSMISLSLLMIIKRRSNHIFIPNLSPRRYGLSKMFIDVSQIGFFLLYCIDSRGRRSIMGGSVGRDIRTELGSIWRIVIDEEFGRSDEERETQIDSIV